jgi:hypothetical protein
MDAAFCRSFAREDVNWQNQVGQFGDCAEDVVRQHSYVAAHSQTECRDDRSVEESERMVRYHHRRPSRRNALGSSGVDRHIQLAE